MNATAMLPMKNSLYRFIALIGLSFLTTCAAPASSAHPNFDACLITNMAAVSMLDEGIEKIEEFLTRAKMTQEAHQAIQAELAEARESIKVLLSLRADMLRDDALDASEQAARESLLMRSYAGGADAAIAEAKANGFSAAVLAERAITCAQKLTE